jgi:D-lyxose ketol-isomerase
VDLRFTFVNLANLLLQLIIWDVTLNRKGGNFILMLTVDLDGRFSEATNLQLRLDGRIVYHEKGKNIYLSNEPTDELGVVCRTGMLY